MTIADVVDIVVPIVRDGFVAAGVGCVLAALGLGLALWMELRKP